jgi:hypothetical protein
MKNITGIWTWMRVQFFRLWTALVMLGAYGYFWLNNPEYLTWWKRTVNTLIEKGCGMLPYPWGDRIESTVGNLQALKVCLNPASDASPHVDDPTLDNPAAGNSPITITLPWTAPSFVAVKGIIHEPGAKPAMKAESRDALLIAIGKARGWIDDIRLGRFASFAEIAKREALCERHIRLLAPLAFLSPRIIAAIVDGTAPAGLTVTGLAKALPYSWAEQERAIGLHL